MTDCRGFFVTGTDTGVGKTWTAVALMAALKKKKLKVLGMKPVASGCSAEPLALINADAQLLREYASFAPPYGQVNPYAFEPAIAPHIAAKLAGITIRFEKIVAAFKKNQDQCDCVVVEGVGGWEVPLNDDQTLADLAVTLRLPVILVVGMRLGCLNHAVLTYNAISRSDVDCAGWVANMIDPNFQFPEENIQTLRQTLEVPLLGRLPNLSKLSPEELAQALNVDRVVGD